MRFFTTEYFPYGRMKYVTWGDMSYGPTLNSYKANRQNHRTRNAILVGLVIVLLVVAGLFAYRWWRNKQARSTVVPPNPQTELGNQEGSDEAARNTNEQNQALASTSPSTAATAATTLPKPLLAKSSGNNNIAVSKGAVIEFTCSAPAGYQCSIVLTGPKTITLESKSLVDNGRGQSVVSWTWTAESGSWQVKAILKDNKGNQSQSDAQALEVKV